MRRPPRGKQGPEDANEIAFRVAERATDEDAPAESPGDEEDAPSGQAGGLRGGPARAEALTPERRAEIARQAAMERWRRWRNKTGGSPGPQGL